MSITVGDKEYRNLPEQVEKNANDIARLFALFGGLGTIMRYCGSVATYADLPDADDPDLQTGDVYNVIDTGSNYAWDGEAWDEFGTSVDLSNYPTLNGDNTFTGTNLFNNGVYFSTEQYEEEYIAVTNSYFTFQTYMDDFLFKGGNLLSETGGGYSLGDSTHAWTDLYLSGKINPNSSTYGLTIPDTSAFTADSELLDSASAQTISGVKTFSNGIVLNGSITRYVGNNDRGLRWGTSALYCPTAPSYRFGNMGGFEWGHIVCQNLIATQGLKRGDGTYKLTLPDTTSWTANKEISTTKLYRHAIALTLSGSNAGTMYLTNNSSTSITDVNDIATAYGNAVAAYYFYSNTKKGAILDAGLGYLDLKGSQELFDAITSDTITEL